VTRQCADAR